MKDNVLFYTASMAGLCADQGYFEKSAEIYRYLLEADPDNDAFLSALDAIEEIMAGEAESIMAETESLAVDEDQWPDSEAAMAAEPEADFLTADDLREEPEPADAGIPEKMRKEQAADRVSDDAATEDRGGLEPMIKKWVELMIERDLKDKFDRIKKVVKHLQPPDFKS